MALKQRALQFFHLSAPEVYDRVCAELNNIAFLVERGVALMHIQRARVATVYALPAVMSELGEMLEGYVPANAIFQGHVAAEDGTFATISASDDMINRLNRCSELHIKPTFQGHPAVCILCERRTAILYSAIWEFLLELVPDMDSTLRVVYAYVANLSRRRQYQRRPYGNGENAAPPRVPRADGRPRAHREPPRGPRRRPPQPEPGPDPPPEPQPLPARPEPQPEPQQPPPRPEPQSEQQQPPPEPPLVPQPEPQQPPPRPDLQPERQQPPAEPPLIPQPNPQLSPPRPDRQSEQQQPPPDPPLVPQPEPQRPPPGPEPEPDLRTEPQPNQHPDVQPHLHDNVNEIRAFEDQLAEDTEPPECRLCLLNLAKIVFIPCGHLAACLRCSTGMDITDQWNLESNPRYRSVCPLCKTPFDIKVPVS